jgi:hypothetical protein
MKLTFVDYETKLKEHIVSKFPKISEIIKIEISKPWKEFNLRIETDEHDVGFGTSIKYTVEDDVYYVISTRKLNYELKRLQENYEESVKRVTEAKFKYQMLKLLVQKFVYGEIDEELKFDRGNIISPLNLKYNKIKYHVSTWELLEPTPIDELLVYEDGYDRNYNIGIPIYEFVNDTDNSIKKLKTMAANITKCCLEYYHRKEKLESRYIKIVNRLEKEKEDHLAKLYNWKEN